MGYFASFLKLKIFVGKKHFTEIAGFSPKIKNQSENFHKIKNFKILQDVPEKQIKIYRFVLSQFLLLNYPL